MKLKDGVGTEYYKYAKTNTKDPYSKATVTYAKDWAEEMERHLEKGLTIEQCADECGHLVDRRPEYGITGFMFGCAVQGLAQFWIHGEELRIWHNAKYGVGADKKGTVNPAILTITKRAER